MLLGVLLPGKYIWSTASFRRLCLFSPTGSATVEQTVAEFGIAKAVVNFQTVGLRKVAAAQLG